MKPNRTKYQALDLESEEYCKREGIDLVPVEYLRQKFKIVSGEEVSIEYFKERVGIILQWVEEDEDGVFICKDGTELLRPPEPPKEYPPLPEGWENCEI